MNRPPEQAISFVDSSLVFDTLVNGVLRDRFIPDDPLSHLMAYKFDLIMHVMRWCISINTPILWQARIPQRACHHRVFTFQHP